MRYLWPGVSIAHGRHPELGVGVDRDKGSDPVTSVRRLDNVDAFLDGLGEIYPFDFYRSLTHNCLRF